MAHFKPQPNDRPTRSIGFEGYRSREMRQVSKGQWVDACQYTIPSLLIGIIDQDAPHWKLTGGGNRDEIARTEEKQV